MFTTVTIHGRKRRVAASVLESPPRLAVTGFGAMILAGTALLMLPIASTADGIGFVDALFTSTSAVCVTGLTVLDTGTVFSPFGRLVLLILIQAGGLGIMTVSTLFLLLSGRHPGLAGQMAVQEAFTPLREKGLSSILRDVVLFTLTIEGLGTALLFFCFLREKGIGEALTVSVFHSVSAFCNAGFSLFSDNFVRYREDGAVNLVLCLLIITGGIGFPVLSELRERFTFRHRDRARLSLHARLVLSVTGLLLILGTLLIAFMEWRNTLEPLSVPGRLISPFFQAVSARTAGFNTLPIGGLANETLFFLVILMFIGASPGSCGGGVKTTTVAALAALGLCRMRGGRRAQLFSRTISDESVNRAVGVVLAAALVVCGGTLLLLMTELGAVPHPESRGRFLEVLFEVVSAFGTVGLSTGLTGALTASGKIIITFTMFIGRLGPLMVALAVSRRPAPNYHYAEETVMVG